MLYFISNSVNHCTGKPLVRVGHKAKGSVKPACWQAGIVADSQLPMEKAFVPILRAENRFFILRKVFDKDKRDC